MEKKNNQYVGFWIRRFLIEYLVITKNLSKNTQLSYRDTFRLLLPYVATKSKKTIDKILLDDLSPEIVKDFLNSLESERKCSISSRNQRLAAIHAFAKFVGINNPEYVEWYRKLNIIPLKRATHKLITYLEKPEMDALLEAPDKSSDQGKRDHALLLFLYNTGARADEAAQLTIANLSLPPSIKNEGLATVLIRGKGNKSRRCPLWKQTVKELKYITHGRDASASVFLNRCKQPITRFGIHAMVRRYADSIAEKLPAIKGKRVSPHTIRHTTATHLLQSGVDINTIRTWLGHVSINTTNIYAEINIRMKAKALACCEIVQDKDAGHWRDDKDLMNFLDNL
jgi:site-specific recombinase XerD